MLDNSLRRSGRPMDALGFYKEICARGGFVNRESAKKRIKMPDVFKQLHNHYVNHTYTDIGNNLLNTYERYFLAYEHAHPEDVPDARCVTCEQDRHGKPGQMLRCDSCGDWCVFFFFYLRAGDSTDGVPLCTGTTPSAPRSTRATAE